MILRVCGISWRTWDSVHASPALGWQWAGERYPVLHTAWKGRVTNYAGALFKFEVIQRIFVLDNGFVSCDSYLFDAVVGTLQ